MKETYSLNRYSLQPVEILRSSNCWSLRLALNQKLAGSIPASGAVAVLYWFRNLAVNQVYVGSIPIGHPSTLKPLNPSGGGA